MANKTSVKLCGPCLFEGQSVTSVHFCQDCREFLCSLCTKHHNKFKIMRQHCVTDVKIDPKPVQTPKHIQQLGDYINLQDDTNIKPLKPPEREKKVQPSVTSERDEEDYDLPIDLDVGGMNMYQNTDDIIHVTPQPASQVDKPNVTAPSRPAAHTDVPKDKASVRQRAVPNEYVPEPKGGRSAANKPGSGNFRVKVEDTTLTLLCNITGDMILTTDNQGITFSQPSTHEHMYAFQYKWIRRFGVKGHNQFYFEVGRRCPNGEGIITCISDMCKTIHKQVSSGASSKVVK